jgi:HSP20 family molecular chaperone IbpA|tara:strand:- start:41 stop:463 length:423 start_codon:yes stop_codon:yes gene_type:complete
MKYNAANLDQLLDRITRNSIGMDEYFDKLFKAQAESNYPPYNLVQLSNTESRLEIALAGFKKDEVNVYTEYGKLVVKSEKNHKEKEEQTYVVQGLAQRNFERSWTISDDTEVRSVTFEDGLLTIMLGKVVPEHHARKDWL